MKMHSIYVCFLLIITSSSSFAQIGTENSMRDLENQRRITQLESEKREQQQQLQRLQQQQQFQRTEKLTNDIVQQNAQWQAEEDTKKLQQEIIRMERAAKERAQAIIDATETADNNREKADQIKTSQQNNFVIYFLMFACIGFVLYLVQRAKKEGEMKQHEKFGIGIIVVSVLFSFFSFTISDGWDHRFDLVSNLMNNMQILFWEDGEGYSYQKNYLINFPTKYVIFISFAAAAYGLTTYLGITPSPQRKASSST